MKYVKLNVSFLHGPEYKLWIFISFLPHKLGNNIRIAGQNLPNINIFLIIFDQAFIGQIILSNIKKKTTSQPSITNTVGFICPIFK